MTLCSVCSFSGLVSINNVRTVSNNALQFQLLVDPLETKKPPYFSNRMAFYVLFADNYYSAFDGFDSRSSLMY